MAFDLHITPRELVETITRWWEKRPFGVLAETFFDETDLLRVWPVESLATAADEELARINRMRLSLAVPAPGPDDARRILDDHDALVVTVGRLTATTLRHTTIGAMLDDEDALRHWRSLRRDLQRRLSRGVVIRNVWSGAEARWPSHRYSAGAEEMSRGGITLVGGTDVQHYLID